MGEGGPCITSQDDSLSPQGPGTDSFQQSRDTKDTLGQEVLLSGGSGVGQPVGQAGGGSAGATLAQSPLHCTSGCSSTAPGVRQGSWVRNLPLNPCSGPRQSQIQHEPQHLILFFPPAVEARRVLSSEMLLVNQ